MDAKLADQKAFGIVGIYVADAQLAKDEFDNATKTIANKIATLNSAPSTVALIVNSDHLS